MAFCARRTRGRRSGNLAAGAPIAKINRQPSVEIWGTGSPRREFMHADDVAMPERLTRVLSGSRFVGELLETIPESVAWLEDASDALQIVVAARP